MHLRLLLELVYRLHDDVVEAGPLHDFSLREARHLVIIVVALEQFLCGVAPERLVVGFECLVLQVAPLLVDVLLVKVVLLRRNERCLQALVRQVIPREVSEPWVHLDFLGPVSSKSILRLPLNHLSHKAGSANERR